jgi:ubiquinone/menaquinone biosynthesis C-methylase UbiE
VAEGANQRYQTPAGRQSIAASLADPHRDDRQKPADLAARLGLKAGATVVDLGTGVGYMLPHLAKAVGPSGRVIAQDIFLDFLEDARDRVAKGQLTNVTFVTGSARDPKLPEGQADVVFTLDAYHHFDYPGEMLTGIRKGLKKGGRLAIADFYKRPGAMPNGNAVQHIRLDVDDVIKEVESNGFHLESRSEHIAGSQYLLVFSVR